MYQFPKPVQVKDCVVTSRYSWRTGKALQKYIDDTLKGISKERDFVNSVVRYCRYDSAARGKVYAISGLRSTGKSIGMCQCIRRLKNYDKTVYIQFVRGKDIEFNVLSDILIDLPDNIKYIFIDEISAVRNFVHCSGTLADNYTLDGKKVVIAGTDSYAIECAFGDGLFHRCILNNVTFVSYPEYARTVGGSLKDYLTSGGLYEASSYQGVDGLKSYINTSIAGNIISTILKNHLPDFDGVSGQDVRIATYIILYAIIYSNSRNLSFDRVITAALSDKVIEDKLTLRRLINQTLGIRQSKTIDRSTIQKVLRALEDIGVVVGCNNICIGCQNRYVNYYIVSPYLANNIYSLIVDAMISIGGSVRKKNFSQVNDWVLRNMLVVHAIKDSGYECYFYHNIRTNSEVDLVLLDRNTDNIDINTYLTDSIATNVYLVEIKLSEKPEIAYAKGHWVREVTGGDFKEYVNVVSRKILCMGKTDNEHDLVNCKKFLDNIKNLGNIL